MLNNGLIGMAILLFIVALLLAVIFSCSPSHAEEIRGFMYVTDGDTGKIGDKTIRLWGFDAFEKKQACLDRDGQEVACGIKAYEQLKYIASQGEMSCATTGSMTYGRYVARCTVNGEDVGSLMVRSGWALDYPQYSNGAYKKDQAWAKRRKMGVHDGMKYALPNEYRGWKNTPLPLFQRLFGK